MAYLTYYHLKNPPFDREYDESFLCLGKKVEQVYAEVEGNLTSNAGTLVISGEDGVGKTTLLHYLKDRFKGTYVVTYLGNLPGNLLQAFSQIASELSIHKRFSNKSEFLVLLRNKLQQLYSEEKQWLLLVDNAHLIKGPIAKELYMLSKIRMHEQPVVQIVFAGAAHILDSVLKFDDFNSANPALVQHELQPLSKEETFQYIAHRLQAAGRSKALFKEDALKKIFIDSKGIPQSINAICDRALEEGFRSKKKVIKADIVNRCMRKVAREKKTHQKDGPRKKADTYQKSGQGTDRYTALVITLAVIAFIAFCAFAAYYYFEFFRIEANPWRIEEIAPKENPLINERLRKGPLEGRTTEPGSTVEPGTKVQAETDSAGLRVPDRTNRSGQTNAESAAQGMAALPLEEKIIVYFKHDSNDLSDEAYTRLNRLAIALAQQPRYNLIIRGYTDSSGRHSYNVTISKIRAEAVASYLMARGLAPERIETLGLGPTNPIQSNQTAEGRRMNRRVEIEVISR